MELNYLQINNLNSLKHLLAKAPSTHILKKEKVNAECIHLQIGIFRLEYSKDIGNTVFNFQKIKAS